MKSGKIWGDTESLLITPMIEVHRININPNMQCSMHKHEYKWNMFYCIKGTLEIHTRKNDYELVDITTIKSGEWTTVAPNEFHKFVSKDNHVQALEIYYLNPIMQDIVRETVGGIVEDN